MTAAVSACASASKVHVARNGGIQHTGTQPKMRTIQVSGKTAKQRPVGIKLSAFSPKDAMEALKQCARNSVLFRRSAANCNLFLWMNQDDICKSQRGTSAHQVDTCNLQVILVLQCFAANVLVLWGRKRKWREPQCVSICHVSRGMVVWWCTVVDGFSFWILHSQWRLLWNHGFRSCAAWMNGALWFGQARVWFWLGQIPCRYLALFGVWRWVPFFGAIVVTTRQSVILHWRNSFILRSTTVEFFCRTCQEMEDLGKLKWDGRLAATVSPFDTDLYHVQSVILGGDLFMLLRRITSPAAGDGHYVLEPFPGDHPPTLGQADVQLDRAILTAALRWIDYNHNILQIECMTISCYCINIVLWFYDILFNDNVLHIMNMIQYHNVLQDLVAMCSWPALTVQIISCLKMIDVALLQSKTVLLVTSQKRLAGSQDDPASSIQREGVCNTDHTFFRKREELQNQT